ncbi:MAG: S41 family peptidase [Bacillaceae bacterium]|nr:S41 family peptidase [Bacillaceae bacterium]
MKIRSVVFLVAVSVVLSSLITLTFMQTDEVAGALQGNNGPGQLLTGLERDDQESDEVLASDLQKIREAYEIIKQSYVRDVDSEVLIEGAIEGMLNALEDPYTVYMDTEIVEQFEQSMESSYEGIGAEVSMRNGRVTIVSPFKGSPADRAGLRPNDQIISVNGDNIEGMDLLKAIQKIKGPKGTKATLQVIRPGVPEPLKIVVVRDEIPIKTVYADIIEKNGLKLGKLEITKFGEKTFEDFKKELQSMKENNVDGLLIDVRGNPGGYLDAVQFIADMLVPKNNTILQVVHSDGSKKLLKSTTEGVDLPMVVLIDEGSASASEILAAALKENGHKLVGAPSFGKGTVQSVQELSDKTQIKLTIAKWLTPSGEWIHEKGVKPHIEVRQPDYFYAAPLHGEQELKREMVGNEVKNLQLFLKGVGLSPGRTDGYFSRETEQAVKQFQRQHDLPATGIVDEQTAMKLQDVIYQQIQDPQHDLQLKKAIEVLSELIRQQ